MPASVEQASLVGNGAGRRSRAVSRVMLVLALLVLGGTFFLISPDPDRIYPGTRPWATTSILKEVMRLMSLGGWLKSVQGTEIKDFVFQLGAVAALLLLAVRLVVSRKRPFRPGRPWTVRFCGQLLLVGWVVLAALSASWSSDATLSLGQAALYAFMLAWALGLAGTIERRDIETLLIGLMLISAAGAALCVWYFYERNPYHRPGFPIGNPNTLAASIIPAILLALVMIAAQIHEWRPRTGGRQMAIDLSGLHWQSIAAAAALVPLAWCMALTYARGPLLALGVGIGLLVLLRVGRRARWIISSVAVCGVLLVGGWMLQTARLDAAMARGATLRFRLYMWNYASELWSQRPISGVGAAAFPRFSGQMAIRDRALDPAAFMGDWAAHAHNQLFEVFTEIGMLGGVTFVGGFIAVVIAGFRLMRGAASDRQRWLYLGVLSALAALLTDLMFGVGLYLPGVPAVLFTLMGVIWAASRCREGETASVTAVQAAPALSDRAARSLVALIALVGSVGGGWLAARNWHGVTDQFAAQVALGEKRYDDAIAASARAQERLLEPVRRLFAGEREVRARHALARAAFVDFQQDVAVGAASQPAGEAARQRAIRLCRAAAEAASRLERRAQTLRGMPAVGAKSAEMLAELYRASDPRESARWRRLAEQAWRLQRVYTPFDGETLLALTRYPATLASHIGLLRDALRGETTTSTWDATLQRLAAAPGFADTLARFLVAAGPIDPQTDLDALIASMAPEIHRLAAAYSAMNGAFLDAVRHCARAARLYEPMRTRFPFLYSEALAEEADYTFRASPTSPRESLDLIRTAIEALPQIQQQQLAARARPFQERLVIYLLAAGDEEAARAQIVELLGGSDDPSRALADVYVNGLVNPFLAWPRKTRPPVAQWLDAAIRLEPRHFGAWSWKAWLAGESGDVKGMCDILAAAAANGVSSEALQAIRRSLCQQYPPLCDEIRLPPRP